VLAGFAIEDKTAPKGSQLGRCGVDPDRRADDDRARCLRRDGAQRLYSEGR
jgi:hypothetical protein